MRILFTIEDQAKALELYREISNNKYFENTDQVIKIFYLKTEPEFEKYADEEAAIYFKNQAEQAEKEKIERQKREADRLERKAKRLGE